MVQVNKGPHPLPPTPSNHLTVLAELVKDGSISASEMVCLATGIADTDTTFVPSVLAILPMKNIAADIFTQGLTTLLVDRGIRGMRDDMAKDIPPPKKDTSQQPLAASNTEPSLCAGDDVKECVVVCIDVSGSMQTPFEQDTGAEFGYDARTVDRTRLEAVKQCFYGFRDQTQAHEDKHLLGLVSFSNDVTIHANPTDNFDVFEDVIDDMRTSGSTAIYEAIAVACSQVLRPAATKHPAANLRVVVLSDGQNNCHTITADGALKALASVGAVCDCMIIGGSSSSADGGLRRLVAASEGKCIDIRGLAGAFEALESKAMISLNSRCTGEPDFNREALIARMAKLSSVDAVDAAPMQRGPVLALRKPVAAGPSVPLGVALEAPKAALSSSNKRILKELREIDAVKLEHFRVCPRLNSDGSLSNTLSIIFLGRREHVAYGGRAFLLNVEMPSEYPFRPPRLSFVTPIHHYAISTDGTICLPTLHDQWSPALSLKKILLDLDVLLHDSSSTDPECNLAQRSWLSDLLRTDPDRYYANAAAHSAKHGKEFQCDLETTSLIRLFSGC
jgi:ubiquitin-conjugating enzyme E2 D/E